MKIRNDSEQKILEKMIAEELGEYSSDSQSTFFQRRKSIVDAGIKPYKDTRKSLNAKRNWKNNRVHLEKGIRRYQVSTAGKTNMRKLHKFNVNLNGSGYKGIYTEDFPREEALKTVLSLQTHLIIESQYFIPDLETHISMALMVENALDILEEITRKIRLSEDLDQEELEFLKDLTI